VINDVFGIEFHQICKQEDDGLFGHPWLGEIVVIGKELIQLFDDNSQTLGITVN